VLGWIPWYSDGGLSERQMGAVEAHAAECAECRAELDMVSGAPFEVDFDLPDPDRMFAEITQRIDARAEAESGGSVIPIDRARSLSVDDLETIESWVLDPHAEAEGEALALEEQEGFAAGLFPEFADGESPDPAQINRTASLQRESIEGTVVEGPWTRKVIWGVAAALALFLLGGLGGALVSDSWQIDRANGDYGLASATSETALAAAASPQIDVVFLDSASALEIANALRAEGLEIVSGPSGLGVYRLAFTQAAANGEVPSDADAAAIAARLSAAESPIAMFAEPVP
jgi:hypothetical protein